MRHLAVAASQIASHSLVGRKIGFAMNAHDETCECQKKALKERFGLPSTLYWLLSMGGMK